MSYEPTHLDLFSGIGGFSLAFESVGFKTIAFAEIEPYACAVLKRHWPHVRNFGDVRTVTREAIAGIIGQNRRLDVVTGGFPCQPFSTAGHRRGDRDERFLWPECVRILREIRPRFALFENVSGLLTIDGGRTFNRVLSDVVSVGYDCLWNCVPACAVGALHQRDRIWIMAYDHGGNGTPAFGERGESEPHYGKEIFPVTDSGGAVMADTAGHDGIKTHLPQTGGIGQPPRESRRLCCSPREIRPGWRQQDEPESKLVRVADRLSRRSYEGRLRGLGNAIQPQVAQIFAQAVMEVLCS